LIDALAEDKVLAASLFCGDAQNLADWYSSAINGYRLAAVLRFVQPNANVETITIASSCSSAFMHSFHLLWRHGSGDLGRGRGNWNYIAGRQWLPAVILISSIDGGLGTAGALATQFNKYSLFDSRIDFTKNIHILVWLDRRLFLKP